jgi:hypothetical protein
MTVTLGIVAMQEAKPGKGGELEAFLRAGRDLAVAEEGSVTWYAFKISDGSYGIFDTFAIDGARTAHVNGQIPPALAKVAGRSAGQGTRHPARRRGGCRVTDHVDEVTPLRRVDPAQRPAACRRGC